MRIPSWKTVASVVATASAVLVGGLRASGGQDDPKEDAPGAKAVANAPASKQTGPTEVEARDLFRKAFAAVSGLARDSSSWEYVFEIGRARVEAGDLDGARATFAAAVADAVDAAPPSPYPLVQIARAQIDAGLRDEARATLREAFEVALRIKEEDVRKLGPLLQILNEQVRTRDDKGRDATVGRIERLAAGIDFTQRPFFTSPMYAAWVAAGREEEAFRAVDRLWIGPPAQPLLALFAYGSIAEAAGYREPAAAKPIIERAHRAILNLEYEPNQASYSVVKVATALARAGDFRAARRVATDLPDPKNNVSGPSETLYAIAMIQEARGDRDGAKGTLHAAIAAFDGSPPIPGQPGTFMVEQRRRDGKIVPREGRLPEIAEALARLGDIAPARALLPRIQDFWPRNLLLTFALVERARGDEEAAEADFALAIAAAREPVAKAVAATENDKLVAAVERVRGDARKVHQLDYDLGMLARMQAAAGDLASARVAVAAIIGIDGRRDNDEAHAIAQERLATGRAMSGDLEGAVSEALGLTKPPVRRAALGGAATGYLAWKRAKAAGPSVAK